VGLGDAFLDVEIYGSVHEVDQDLLDRRLRACLFDAPCSPARTIFARFCVGDDEPAGAFVAPPQRHEPSAAALGSGGYYAEWQHYRGYFGEERSEAVLRRRPGALDHALRAAATMGSMPRHFLCFHGATLVTGGEATLFVGQSGAGKSTIAREAGADDVLSNEFSIVGLRNGRWVALPSPFWGTGDVARWGTAAPLRRICVLGQARDRNRWRLVDGAARWRSVIPHVGCQTRAQLGDPELLLNLTSLVSALPIYEFWWHRATPPFAEAPWSP